jgi:hypothetical protein
VAEKVKMRLEQLAVQVAVQEEQELAELETKAIFHHQKAIMVEMVMAMVVLVVAVALGEMEVMEQLILVAMEVQVLLRL